MKRTVAGCVVAVFVAGAAFAGTFNEKDVSATAKWAVHFDMEKFLASNIGKMMTDETTNPELKKGMEMLREKIGFDPMKTVTSVTLYGENLQHGGGVAIIKGPGSPDAVSSVEKMITAIKTHEQISYGSRVIHKWIDEHKNKPAAMCFYAPGVAVASDGVDSVKAAIDVLDGKKDGLKQGAGLKMPANGGFLSGSADKCENNTAEKARAKVLQNAEWITMSLDNSGANVELDLKLGANTAENAQQMEQVVRGMVAFMALSKDRNPGLAEIASAVSVSTDSGVVGVKVSYSAEELHKLMKAMKHRRCQMKGDDGEEKPENTDGAAGTELFKF